MCCWNGRLAVAASYIKYIPGVPKSSQEFAVDGTATRFYAGVCQIDVTAVWIQILWYVHVLLWDRGVIRVHGHNDSDICFCFLYLLWLIGGIYLIRNL